MPSVWPSFQPSGTHVHPDEAGVFWLHYYYILARVLLLCCIPTLFLYEIFE